MRPFTIVLTVLTLATVQLDAGILDWIFGPSDEEWMMNYWEENLNHYSLPKEDAQKLAKACVQYDRNPRQRFVEMVDYSARYGSLLGEAFHYYDPGTRTFTEPLTTTETVNGPTQETHALRLYSLILQNQDYPNANFLERIFNGNRLSLNPSSNGAASSPTPTPDAAAQAKLGFLYQVGKGVPQDYRKAAELYEKAAAQGNAIAQANLGILYHEGKGVPQDYRRAVELFEKAAAQGDAGALAFLALQYAQGKGVPRDYRKALELFHRALDRGPSPNVYNAFAWFLATSPDYAQRNGKEAVEYATKACRLTEWNNGNLIETLAAAYAEIGDFDTAIMYLRQAMIEDSDSSDRQEMERMLELFRHRKPYRQ